MSLAGSSDNQWATVALTDAEYSNWLEARDFGFTIPANSEIRGIEIEWEWSSPSGSAIAEVFVRAVKADVIGVAERTAGLHFTTADTYATYGSTGDLWNDVWTAGDINSPGFGAAAAVRHVSSTQTDTARVDHVRITVHYVPMGCP